MKQHAAVAVLLILGLLQMTGDLLDVPALKGLAAASAASPAPKVFSSVGGFETYSTRFFLEWNDRSGAAHSLELTRDVYRRFRGPYNRRNVYGATLAYGPVLITNPATRPMFESVLAYALCGQAPLLREIGVDPATLAAAPRVRLEPIGGSSPGDLPTVIEAACPP